MMKDLIPYVRAKQFLDARLKTTDDEIGQWVSLGAEKGGLNGYTINKFDGPKPFSFEPRKFIGNDDYLKPLKRLHFLPDDIERFQPASRYISRQALIERWTKLCGAKCEALDFIKARAEESYLFEYHPVVGCVESEGELFRSGLFDMNDVQEIELRYFPESAKVIDEAEVLRERRKAFAQIKASRVAKSDLSNQELLDNPLSVLIQESGLQNADEFEYSFNLYVWKRQLAYERETINPKDYPDRKNYDDRMRALNFKIEEIDQYINCRPVSNAKAKSVVKWNETLNNGKPIDWGYWLKLKNITPDEAAKLTHNIDPIIWPGDRYAAGGPYGIHHNGDKIDKELSEKIRKLKKELDNHSEEWSLGNLVSFLGEENVPFGMLEAVKELAKTETEECGKVKESEFHTESALVTDSGSQNDIEQASVIVKTSKSRQKGDMDKLRVNHFIEYLNQDKSRANKKQKTIDYELRSQKPELWGKNFETFKTWFKTDEAKEAKMLLTELKLAARQLGQAEKQETGR